MRPTPSTFSLIHRPSAGLPSTRSLARRTIGIGALGLAAIALATSGPSGCAADMTGLIAEDVSALGRVRGANLELTPDVIARAQAVAIFKKVQAGVVLGATGGEGIFVKRIDEDTWSAPVPVRFSEGSFGLQIGGQGLDIVYVFNDEAEVDRFTTEGGYFVARASGTAVNASGTADGGDVPVPPVQTFVSAGGLYGGLVLGGQRFDVDEKMLRATYGTSPRIKDILDGKARAPIGSVVLWQELGSPDPVDDVLRR